MSKILVIGVSNAGRNVCKKLKDKAFAEKNIDDIKDFLEKYV